MPEGTIEVTCPECGYNEVVPLGPTIKLGLDATVAVTEITCGDCGYTGDPVQRPRPHMDAVYLDRNLLVCGFIACLVEKVRGGWTPADGPGDDADPDEWALAWATLPGGQVSWHIPRGMAEKYLPRDDAFEYDGHNRAERNGRLATWMED